MSFHHLIIFTALLHRADSPSNNVGPTPANTPVRSTGTGSVKRTAFGAGSCRSEEDGHQGTSMPNGTSSAPAGEITGIDASNTLTMMEADIQLLREEVRKMREDVMLEIRKTKQEILDNVLAALGK